MKRPPRSVDWNAELVRGDLGQAVQRLKQEPGEGLFVGGVTLPLALADLGLTDEYEFLVQPVLAGHGPTLLAGLRERIQLELVDRHEFRSGRSPCDTGPRELRLDVIRPGTLAAASRRNDGIDPTGWGTECTLRRHRCPPGKPGARWRMPVSYPGPPSMGTPTRDVPHTPAAAASSDPNSSRCHRSTRASMSTMSHELAASRGLPQTAPGLAMQAPAASQS